MTGSDVAGRPAPSIGWHRALSGADQQRIRDLIAAASAHDGVAPVGDQVLRELPGDRTRHLLAVDGDDLVGYLNLSPADAEAPALAELVVHPRARRRGIGSAMGRIGLAEGGPGTRIWAHGNLEPARGGVDAETLASLRQRGPRAIRHHDRAVTIEDYEDLAMLASPEVARAKCVVF